MPHALKLYLVALVTILVLDFLWLGVVMRTFYRAQLAPLARMADGGLAPLWPVAGLVYALLALGAVAFILPRAAASPDLAGRFGWGAIFGLITYGVYDLTNYSTLAGWPATLTAVDMGWGAVLCGSLGVVLPVADAMWR